VTDVHALVMSNAPPVPAEHWALALAANETTPASVVVEIRIWRKAKFGSRDVNVGLQSTTGYL
jgi:hypothetical protein